MPDEPEKSRRPHYTYSKLKGIGSKFDAPKGLQTPLRFTWRGEIPSVCRAVCISLLEHKQKIGLRRKHRERPSDGARFPDDLAEDGKIHRPKPSAMLYGAEATRRRHRTLSRVLVVATIRKEQRWIDKLRALLSVIPLRMERSPPLWKALGKFCDARRRVSIIRCRMALPICLSFLCELPRNLILPLDLIRRTRNATFVQESML